MAAVNSYRTIVIKVQLSVLQISRLLCGPDIDLDLLQQRGGR